MPALVEKDDLLLGFYAGDGVQTGLITQTGDLQGWNMYATHTTGSTIVAGLLYKIADGNESGLTLFPGSSTSEKWCVSCHSFGDVHLYRTSAFRFDSGSGSNPNPAAIPISGTQDRMFLAALAGDGSNVITGFPAGYSQIHNLNNAAADGVAFGLGEKYETISSEDPGAWTRGSASYITYGIGWRGWIRETHPRIINKQSEILSGTTKDYTVTIPLGKNRKFIAIVHAASANITSVVLDPAGLNSTLSVLSDGSTSAATSAAGTARGATVYTLHPCPPAGTYTLRVSTSVSADVALISATINNAKQSLLAHDVATGTGTSGTITAPANSLHLTVGVQPLSAQPNAIVWTDRPGVTWVSTMTAPHYMSLFATDLTGSPRAFEVGGQTSQAWASFTIEYQPRRFNPPLFSAM